MIKLDNAALHRWGPGLFNQHEQSPPASYTSSGSLASFADTSTGRYDPVDSLLSSPALSRISTAAGLSHRPAPPGGMAMAAAAHQHFQPWSPTLRKDLEQVSLAVVYPTTRTSVLSLTGWVLYQCCHGLVGCFTSVVKRLVGPHTGTPLM